MIFVDSIHTNIFFYKSPRWQTLVFKIPTFTQNFTLHLPRINARMQKKPSYIHASSNNTHSYNINSPPSPRPRAAIHCGATSVLLAAVSVKSAHNARERRNAAPKQNWICTRAHTHTHVNDLSLEVVFVCYVSVSSVIWCGAQQQQQQQQQKE